MEGLVLQWSGELKVVYAEKKFETQRQALGLTVFFCCK